MRIFRDTKGHIWFSSALTKKAGILIHHGPRSVDIDVSERIDAERDKRAASVTQGGRGDV
jgi:hypothetical protein